MAKAIFLQTSGLFLNVFELDARTKLFPDWIFFALLVAMAMITSVRFLNANYFNYIWNALTKNAILQIEYRTGFSQIKNSALILKINYFLTTTIAAIMIATYFNQPVDFSLLATPLLIYFYPQVGLLLSGVLTGEQKKLGELFRINTVIYQTFGLLLLPLLFIWLLHPNHSIPLIYALITLFGILYLLRVIKIYSKAIENKIPWYYIILYFCTAEIWSVILIIQLQY